MVEQDENKQAVINAIRALDQIDEVQQSRSNAPQLPGLVVQIINNGPASADVKVLDPDATE